jgi:hypothetical protein
MISPEDYPEAEEFMKRQKDLLAKHRNEKIFLAEPLSGLEEKALEDASRIKDIAERHGFGITEVYSHGTGPILRVIIGDIHGVPDKPGFFKYQPNITKILQEMVSSGFLGRGDEFCYESRIVGTVDYSKSNENLFILSGGIFKPYKQFCLVHLLDTFREAGIKSVCNDDKLARELMDAMDKETISTIDRAEQAASYKDMESYAKHALISALQRDTYLLERMRRGMGHYLANKVAAGKRAVQLMGIVDVFTEVAQNMLKEKGISYLAIFPVLDRKAA